ncbi:MAG: redoxin domain-containing protein [Flavobacteriales bacterium]|nr:redoxin domain-containing protein [Flavobacteriales bacterium]
MRTLSAIAALACVCNAGAQQTAFHVHAPDHVGKVALLYRYDDLFTLRPVQLDQDIVGEDGHAELTAIVEGTAKLRLRIGDANGDLYARPDLAYSVRFPAPDPRTPRSINGTMRVDLAFSNLDPLDVNALTSDLNERIDGFIMEDLATDEVAGMQALEVQRRADAAPTDSTKRPPTLFVMPTWSKLRVDTFELKVRNFYRDVKDPWFANYLDYSFAGLRHGPRVNEQELFERYLKDKPVRYDDPEYVRFVRSFYSEHLYLAKQTHETRLQRAFAAGSADSLKAILAENEFLKNNERLCELVMVDLLYQQYNGKLVVRDGAERILAQVAAGSSYAEHRTIATNILWDLITMRVGSRLPPVRLEDDRGHDMHLDSLLSGPVCIAVTASWCSYCDLEMQGLEQLHKEFGSVVPIIAISLDEDLATMRKYMKAHPGMDLIWLHAVGEQRLRDDWRVRSIPAFYLLNDGVLARSPAPLPSQGLGALFQQAKAEAEKGSRVKVWDD